MSKAGYGNDSRTGDRPNEVIRIIAFAGNHVFKAKYQQNLVLLRCCFGGLEASLPLQKAPNLTRISKMTVH
jgi:hypothetical protein